MNQEKMKYIKLVKIFCKGLFFLFLSILVVLGIGYYLMSHPRHHDIYFNIDEQQLISCDKIKFRMLSLKNENNEESLNLFWENNKDITDPPEFLDLNNIPKEYRITSGGIKSIRPFRLKFNTSYSIEKSGGGSPSFKIRIWTDSRGKVYKTTHSSCGLESLEED